MIVISFNNIMNEAEALILEFAGNGIEMHPRNDAPARILNYYEEVVPNYTDYEFYSHFRMSRESVESTAHLIFQVIIDIVTNLLPQFVRWPDANGCEVIEAGFLSKPQGFPGIIGAIDGCHIEILQPPGNANDYYNRKEKHSIILQDNGHLTRRQVNYNIKHASSRSIIERAFGLLKGKFRRLQYLNVKSVEMAIKMVSAACTLHNFILIQGDVNVGNNFPGQNINNNNIDNNDAMEIDVNVEEENENADATDYVVYRPPSNRSFFVSKLKDFLFEDFGIVQDTYLDEEFDKFRTSSLTSAGILHKWSSYYQIFLIKHPQKISDFVFQIRLIFHATKYFIN
ncbi:Protein of unknown function [Cotesia congregata]|uniref:DDE Tnp4 domain-containing protein n=1 Tax=Cotesia congregata TaxID=51543 RepID=A0A8J2H3Q0_COTCN|nr:Protein of unknown function [Cotesia congregata]